MRCRQAKEKIRRKLDGTLAREDQAHLEVHLEACAKCRAELAALSKVVSWLEDLESVPAPANFDREVLHKVRLERARAEERLSWREILEIGLRRWLRPAVAAVSLVVLAAFAGPVLVRASSGYVAPRLAEPLARGTVRLVELANDPDRVEALSDRAREVSSPIGIVGKTVYGGLMDMIVPVLIWCVIGIAGVSFICWISRHTMQRRTRNANAII